VAVVERVLPWRRERQAIVSEVASLVAGFDGPRRKEQIDLVQRAYKVAEQAHQGQRRKSGEPYITHPLAVAGIVANLGLDDVTIAAALLHDAVEDTSCTLADIQDQFGEEVAAIVDGVTKLDRLRFQTKEAQQAATFRKMLVAMAKDVRVLIIKLSDRLHNMRTIAAIPRWKQERTARETLDVYAPLAHRLGIQEVKTQLEDLSFAALHPKRFGEFENMVAARSPERELYLTQVLEDVRGRIAELNIDAEVTGREKHLYSIYEKMVVKGKEFTEINDLIGIRVVVDSVRDCYAALGSIHATWKPVQGRFKDYVAMPKFNLYQSLHTTVIGPQGKPIEVQIRTKDMHARAEFGVAAHFVYKENPDQTGKGPKSGPGLDLAWLDRIIGWEEETNDPGLFMANLKVDLDQDEIFVFTPQGAVVTLPTGSTPVDFAYTIHTDIGHRTVGAKVEGKLVALTEQLNSGETVEIFTSKVDGAGPSQDWLTFVRSPRAASKIKQWFSRERREDAMSTGQDDLQRELRRDGLPVQKIAAAGVISKVAEKMNYPDVNALYVAIGDHQVSAKSIAARVHRELDGSSGREESLPVTARRKRRRRPGGSPGVHVEGLDDVLIRLSRCCTPVPGDEILGFVTRGRGVSVHRSDCANGMSLATNQDDRLIDVEWDAGDTGMFIASAEVKAYDRSHLLSEVSRVFSENHVNILSSQSQTGSDRMARLKFEFEIADPSHLEELLRATRKIDGVYDAYRVLPGRGA